MRQLLNTIIFPPSAALPLHERERLRRRRELILAGLTFVLALILTRILFYLYDTGSALFITVFSLNFLLLLVIAGVVIRNGLKLVLERRRGVLGSRLRTRLILAFMGLTLAPCLLMFLLTTKFVQLSVDFWFKDQVTTSMETALEVGRADLDKTGQRLLAASRLIQAEVGERRLIWGGAGMDLLLARKQQEMGFELAGLLGPDRQKRLWHSTADAEAAWQASREQLNWDAAAKQGQTVLGSGLNNDYVLAVQAAPGSGGAPAGYLVLAESMGPVFKAKLDRIASGASEYKQLWRMRRELKGMLYVGLGVLTLLIMLGTIWFGFRVAKEISSPVLALADAAQRIARGDLAVRLDDYAGDEMGMMIRAFNRMTGDLAASRERLTGANKLLAEQNREIVQHSQYIETVLNNIASGVISADQDGRISVMNKAAGSILGNAPANLVGKTLADLLPPDMGRMIQAMLEQFRRRPLSHWQRQISIPFAGQERRLLVNAAGLVTPEGENRGFVAVFEDVSELEKMQRMAAWREVARRIAHEIKNPLTPIKLSAQRLQRKFGAQVRDPVFSQSTNLIVQQVESLQEMVQEFSAFAKLPEVDPQPGDLRPLLIELAELYRGSHPRIRWDVDLPAGLPVLPMDKNALRRAFMNIITNAVDALEGVEKPHIGIRAVLESDRNLVRVDVADNGPGLTEEERSRLFEPYFSRKKGGTGLGLTIVKSVIADHKGYVRAGRSSEGGAALTVELPLA